MHRAGYLESPTFAYETWGELNEARDNAILSFTGLSPSAHVASCVEDPSPGWWEEMVGSEHPIDSDRYFIICVNSLGSCFGTTGPASVNPATGKRYRLSFPVLTLEDIAESAWYVVQQLGIEVIPWESFDLEPADFLDINHMNARGGREKLSRQLAERVAPGT